MLSLRERQIHMTQLIKKLDRMVIEKHKKFNFPFFHYQKPLAVPGERDSVCVYIDSVRREYFPYGVVLEKMLEEARMWVKTGEGPRPEVVITTDQMITLVCEEKPAEADDSAKASDEGIDEQRANRVGARRKIFSSSAEKAGLSKNRVRPPTKFL